MSANYSSPYDSPIEDAFAYSLTKHLADDVELEVQVATPTICGCFVIDLVLRSPMIGCIGIECDGRESHDAHRDEWRDAAILGVNFVDVIYRLRGSDITYHLDDVLYLIGQLETGLFSSRGTTNLRALASQEARSQAPSKESDIYRVRYAELENGFLQMEARRVAIPKGQRRFWQTAYQFAESIGGGNLDAVMERYAQQPFLTEI